ncbi:MAG: hypothetical protein HZA20_00165 [Nitrospirae bacterium]|jgi:hypothetical protein|nr:hypothetical protein [Nitrospirota bacterium]
MKASGFICSAIIVSALSFSSAIAGAANGGAVAGWEMRLNIAQGSAGINVYLGQRADATDGIDGYYDVPAFTSEGFDAHLSLEDGRYWRDIRQYRQGSAKTWLIVVQPSDSDAISIKWKTADIPANLTLILSDPDSGTVIDMKHSTSYEVPAEHSHQLMIDAVSN